MSIEEKILQRLERMERQIRLLRKEEKVETWVTAPIITGLTGWNSEGMRRARQNKWVKYKAEDGKFTYLLESLNSLFIK